MRLVVFAALVMLTGSTTATATAAPSPAVAKSCSSVITLALLENQKTANIIVADEELLLQGLKTSRTAPLTNAQAAAIVRAAKSLGALEASLQVHGSVTNQLNAVGKACFDWALLGA